MHYFYILRCADDTEYVGCTNDLEERLERHRRGFVEATKNRLPTTLVCQIGFPDKYSAFNFEKYLKSGSGRAFLKRHLA